MMCSNLLFVYISKQAVSYIFGLSRQKKKIFIQIEIVLIYS